jgi:hypothetical protein
MTRSLFTLAVAGNLLSSISLSFASPVAHNEVLFARQEGKVCVVDDYLQAMQAVPSAATSLCRCFLSIQPDTSVIASTVQT